MNLRNFGQKIPQPFCTALFRLNQEYFRSGVSDRLTGTPQQNPAERQNHIRIRADATKLEENLPLPHQISNVFFIVITVMKVY